MMKVKNLIISLVLVALTVIGWFSVLAANTSEAVAYKNSLKLAQKYVDEGLYQRAIREYNKAIEYNDKEENYELLFKAYEKRMEEDKGIVSEYIVDLARGVKAHPNKYNFHKTLIDLYYEAGDEEEAYKCILNALEYHKKDELIKIKNKIRYKGEAKTLKATSCTYLSSGYYTVEADGGWAVLNAQDAKISKGRYEYISPLGENQTRIETGEKDSRLLCEDNFVLGIFKEKVYEAGLFADGLIPVKTKDKYYYYDEFAKVAIDKGFDKASSFKNGVAAVKDGNVWYFIDTDGKKVSGEFADVVINKNLSYTLDENFVAAKKAGEYAVYDKKFEKVSKKTYKAIDFKISGDIIAFQGDDGKWGFATLEGDVKIKAEYEAAKGFSNGLAAVRKNGKWGFINTSGDLVIECTFEDADYFNSYGTCVVVKSTTENYAQYGMYVLEYGIMEE